MNEPRVGTFLKMPYDFREPTKARFKKRMWNAEDKRIITPRFFGWGFDTNWYQLGKKIGLIKK
jgi:hypothetical protein